MMNLKGGFLMEKPKTLIEQTTDAIIQYIKDNNIGPEEKLPNEYTLSQQLNVGRSTFREAIRILVSRNILEVRQGSGTYVSPKEGQSSDPFGIAMIRDKTKIISDLYDMRYILEPEVAMLAATHATQVQIDQMKDMVDKIEESFEAGTKDHVEYDIKLHSLIGASSGNLAYSYILPIINESISLFNKSYDIPKGFTKRIHREIVDAIASHNQMAARDSMLIHMADNRMVYNEILAHKSSQNGRLADE